MTQTEIIEAIKVLSELLKSNSLNFEDLDKIRKKIMRLLDMLAIYE